MSTACEICGGVADTIVHPNVFGMGANLVRCSGCGFKFYDKMVQTPDEFYNSPASDDFAESSFRFKTQSPERWQEHLVDENVRIIRAFYVGLLTRAVELLGRSANTLYEVGTDYGALLDAARSIGIEATGCDINRRAVDIARNRMGLNVTWGNFLEVDVPSGRDLLVLFDVLEHVWCPRAIMERVAQHIAPDGIVLIKTFYDEFHLTLPDFDVSHLPQEWERTGYFGPAVHPSHFDKPVLRDLLARTGFEILEETSNEIHGQITIFARLAGTAAA